MRKIVSCKTWQTGTVCNSTGFSTWHVSKHFVTWKSTKMWKKGVKFSCGNKKNIWHTSFFFARENSNPIITIFFSMRALWHENYREGNKWQFDKKKRKLWMEEATKSVMIINHQCISFVVTFYTGWLSKQNVSIIEQLSCTGALDR